MDIGSNIKKYRKKAGLTQKELAEILNVAVGTIQQYELNKREPRLEKMNRIAEALGIEIKELYPKRIPSGFKDMKTGEDIYIDRDLNLEIDLTGFLLEHFRKLNINGKIEATKRVEELTELPRYTQKEE